MTAEDGVVELDPEELVDAPPLLLRSRDSLADVVKDENRCCINGRLGEVLILGEQLTVIVVLFDDAMFRVVTGTALPAFDIVGECIPRRGGI